MSDSTFDGTPLKVARKTGREKFRNGATECDFDLLSFWQWGASDLVGNTARGVLAEYIVAKALGIADVLRDDWRPFDLQTKDGLKIEVKSAAYIQSWKQDKPSIIQYGVPKRLAWDAKTGKLGTEVRRHAEVYVFALLNHKIRETIDPLDLAQWEFYVLPTKVLDERERSQHSISLASLQKLAGKPVGFGELGDAVKHRHIPTA